jgi:hypothetical protein
MSKVYIASSSSETKEKPYEETEVAFFMNMVRSQGLEITFDWLKNIYDYFEKYPIDIFSEQAQEDLMDGMTACLTGIDDADVCIVYCTKDIDDSIGAQREIGYMMAHKERVYFYKPYHNSGYRSTTAHPFSKLCVKRAGWRIIEDNIRSFYEMCQEIRSL